MKKILILCIVISLYITTICAQQPDNGSTNAKTKNGWDYYVEGNYQASVKALQEEKRYYPNRINIYVILGWDYKKLKKFSDMEKVSLEGLKVRPGDVRVIQNLAEAYFFQYKYDKAVKFFEQYIAHKYNMQDPYLATAYFFIGSAYYEREKFRKADIALSAAKYYKPKDVYVLVKLAQTKEKLNESAKALELYQASLLISPNNKEALEGVKRLEVVEETKDNQ